MNATVEDDLPPFAMTNTSMRILSSFTTICFFMWLGHILREKIACTRRIMLPASLIGGILALIFTQLCGLNDDVLKVVEHDFMVGWNSLPGFLINIVFATLLMGTPPPSAKQAWELAGPQLCYGMVLAFGNWVIATFVTMTVLLPFEVNPLFSSLFPVGFEGGHGTAAGLKDSYIALGFPEGGDLAVTSASIGIIFGVLFGTVLCNIGDRYQWTYSSWERAQAENEEEEVDNQEMGYASTNSINRINPEAIKDMKDDDGQSEETPEKQPLHRHHKTWRDSAVVAYEDRVPGSFITIGSDALDTFAINLTFVGLACMLAFWTKRALTGIESTSEWLTEYAFLSGFPVFPFAMIWGLVIQLICDRLAPVNTLDKGTMDRISGAALDFLVLSAIATTKMDAVAENIAPLAILILLGFAYQLVCFFFIAPIMLPNFWFERAIAEYGKSTGTTSIGLLLLKTVDPDKKTPAFKAFAAKQGLAEPFVGGGIWTSLALPIITASSNWVLCGIAFAIVFFFVSLWFFTMRKLKLGPMIQYRFDPRYNPMY